MKKTFLAIATMSIFNFLNAAEFNLCASCHGDNADKKALSKSKIIAGWPAKKTIHAIKGYQDGSYGGIFKKYMRPYALKLTDSDLEKIAKKIESLKIN